MLKDKSVFKTSMGNEAATKSFGMGVVTHQIQGEASFLAWSMDVKFEGENVPRHLDIMGHNEACNPTDTPPWPFLDSADLDKSTNPCHKTAEDVKTKCGKAPAKPEDNSSGDCCAARKCMLVPFTPNKCCSDAAGSQKTPHHPVPFQDHYPVGSRKLPVAQRKPVPGAGSYDGNKAPCICLDGTDHGKLESASPPRHMQHGRCGRAFAYLRDILLGSTYKYTDVNVKTAKTVAYHAECNAECIQAQMDEYHIKRAGATGELRKSRQARKGGEDYYSEAIPQGSEAPSTNP